MCRYIQSEQTSDKGLNMKFAVVNARRQEAQPGLRGECQGCGELVIAKCGQIRIHHWAHRGQRSGDPWWEPETPWHRDWKNHFPGNWQEIWHRAEDGEKHVADVVRRTLAVF